MIAQHGRQIPRTPSFHGSQTMRRDALVRHFNFPRASHKSKISAVLFHEQIRVKFNEVCYNFTKEQLLFMCEHTDSQ